jgi:protein-arginine kinase activator protein McsA
MICEKCGIVPATVTVHIMDEATGDVVDVVALCGDCRKRWE